MNRLPDFDLEVIVNAAAEGMWNTRASHVDGPTFDEISRGKQNEIREAALPFIFHGTNALADLGYHRHRIITTIEELDALPHGTVVMDIYGSASTIVRDNALLPPERFHYIMSNETPATVLYEPEMIQP